MPTFMRSVTLLLICLQLVCTYLSAPSPPIVLFGDSLSDDANGFAGNAKFVLRTNQVSSNLMSCLSDTVLYMICLAL